MVPAFPQPDAIYPTREDRPGCGSYGALIAAGAWILAVTILAQLPAWFIDNLRMESANGLAGWIWVAVTWGQCLLILLALVPLARLTRQARLRAVYVTWTLAAGAAALLALARIFSVEQVQPAVAAESALSLAGAAILALAAYLSGRRLALGGSMVAPALALAALASLPSLIWGALGSPLDAALGLAAGLGFGLLAAVLLAGWLLGPAPALARGERAVAIFGAGTALFILGSAFGFRGSQFLFMIALPPLGITAVGLEAWRMSRTAETPGAGGAWLPPALLTGLAAAVLSMFWDPSELSLLLGPDDALSWALRAAEVTLAVAAVLGLIMWLLLAGQARRVAGAAGQEPAGRGAGGRAMLAIAAVGAWVLAGVLYAALGRPGFYGEQLSVILRDQADVQAAYQMPDRVQRLAYVYHALTQHADQTQARLRQALAARGIAYQPYYLVNGLQVNGGPVLRAYLAGQPEVARVLNSPHLRPLPAQPAPSRGDAAAPTSPPWGITAIGADRVWRDLGVTGKGIVIGQSDSGVQGDHPALAGAYRGRTGGDDYNWLDPWNGTTKPTDSGGHGTHTLGTMLGQGGLGVAPGAEWMACVNLARNLGNPAWYLNCLQFMLAPYPERGNAFTDGDPSRAAHVLNNSWGCPPVEGCDAEALAAATEALRAAGIYVVASAGNGGPACGSVSDPIALYNGVFTVGAIDDHGALADFSSRGPVTVDGSNRIKPDIVAPGVDVLSAFPGSTYSTESGTSMAGPHVAGVVALMWSAQPKLIGQIDQTTQILIQTAQPYKGPRDDCSRGGVPNNDAGYGVVDAYAAVQAALAVK